VNNKSPKAPSSPSEAEINKFYNENKEEFGKKKLGLVKNDIQLRIKKQKFDLWITEMSKILEDEVAGGSSLKEIADKYSFSIISEKNVTEQNIERKAGGIFSMFSSVIFDMNEKEVSYPADFQNEGIILFEVSKYLPEKIQEFESVKKDVLDKYKAFAHQQETLKRLQDFAQNTDKALFIKEAELLGMSVQNAKSFSRAEMSSIPNLSPEILVSIFSSPTNTIKGPIISNGKAYMFMVTKAYKDTAIGKNLTNAKDDITSKIREGLMEELLFYAQNKSKMKVKIAPNLLKMSKGGE
jgi:hypothetical protein